MDDDHTKLQTLFREIFYDDDIVIVPEMTADDVPEWDSLSHIRLILAVQKAFSVKFAAAEIGQLKNVGDLTALIHAKTAGLA